MKKKNLLTAAVSLALVAVVGVGDGDGLGGVGAAFQAGIDPGAGAGAGGRGGDDLQVLRFMGAAGIVAPDQRHGAGRGDHPRYQGQGQRKSRQLRAEKSFHIKIPPLCPRILR